MRNIGLEFTDWGQVGFRELGRPSHPGPTALLLETLFTGITNGTERHALLTEHGFGGGQFPSQHGYQHVARVAEIGSEVTRFKTGDTVFYGDYVGHNGWNIVDENALLLKLPENIEHQYCALFGVAGVALHAVRRMGVRPGDNVWVVGQGPIGHFLAQSARSAGAQVTVSDRIQQRLAVARTCGAHRTLDATNPAIWQMLKKQAPFHFIFDCCSDPSLLADIFENQLLARGGTIGMMAVRDQVTYPWSLLHGTEGKIETSCHFNHDVLRVLLFLYEHKLIRIAPMVSHVVAITEAPGIYEMLARRGTELLGVIFDWRDAAS